MFAALLFRLNNHFVGLLKVIVQRYDEANK